MADVVKQQVAAHWEAAERGVTIRFEEGDGEQLRFESATVDLGQFDARPGGSA